VTCHFSLFEDEALDVAQSIVETAAGRTPSAPMSDPLNYVTKLSPELLRKVHELWQEDDRLRAQFVRLVRDWLKQQPHLHCRTGEQRFRRSYGPSLELGPQRQSLEIIKELGSDEIRGFACEY